MILAKSLKLTNGLVPDRFVLFAQFQQPLNEFVARIRLVILHIIDEKSAVAGRHLIAHALNQSQNGFFGGFAGLLLELQLFTHPHKHVPQHLVDCLFAGLSLMFYVVDFGGTESESFGYFLHELCVAFLTVAFLFLQFSRKAR